MESKVSARLKQPLAKEVLEHLFLPRLNREFFANFDMLTQINLAHLLMLRERGILDHDCLLYTSARIPKPRNRGSWTRASRWTRCPSATF